MEIAWSLHLLQVTERTMEGSGQGQAQSHDLGGPAVNEEFVLRALCKLLEAALYYQIISIIPKLCEFVRWFDGTGLLTYCCVIFTWIEEAVRQHQEFEMLHRFNKFHCMWYI